MSTADPALSPADDQSLPAGGEVVAIEAVSEETPVAAIEAPSSSDQVGDTLLATQAIISRQASRLDSLKDEARKIADSMRSIMDNDAELTVAQQEMESQTKRYKERKTALAQSAESMQLKYKYKELKDQVKELEESLNNHLLNYFQMTGTKVFDTDTGEQREFKIIAKVLGKKSKVA